MVLSVTLGGFLDTLTLFAVLVVVCVAVAELGVWLGVLERK